jgi:serine/threonine protein kinase
MPDTPHAKHADQPQARTHTQPPTAEETLAPAPPPPQVTPAKKNSEHPQQLGRYRILKPLGQGAMGAVYLAEDTELQRRVALKVPTLPPGEKPEWLERFYREARAAATLQHPNICPVHDIGEHEGTRYITMGYISGPPLSKLVGSEKIRSERTVVKLVRKIALALVEAHAKGIVHRDLKPANILLDEHGKPVVTDFGLARRVDQQEESRLTQQGAILGTPAYMAPE